MLALETYLNWTNFSNRFPSVLHVIPQNLMLKLTILKTLDNYNKGYDKQMVFI
jgi:hypothetical protein